MVKQDHTGSVGSVDTHILTPLPPKTVAMMVVGTYKPALRGLRQEDHQQCEACPSSAWAIELRLSKRQELGYLW